MKILLYTLLTTLFVGVTTSLPHDKTSSKSSVPAPAPVSKTQRFMDSLTQTARLDAQILKLRQDMSASEIRLACLRLMLLQKTRKTDSIFVDPGIISRTNHTTQ